MYNAQSRVTKDKINLTIENNSYAIVERFGKHYAIKVKSIIDNCPSLMLLLITNGKNVILYIHGFVYIVILLNMLIN